jgi:N6-adenosine-specific RNA methylase IME4
MVRCERPCGLKASCAVRVFRWSGVCKAGTQVSMRGTGEGMWQIQQPLCVPTRGTARGSHLRKDDDLVYAVRSSFSHKVGEAVLEGEAVDSRH